jgi:hypothetical protein
MIPFRSSSTKTTTSRNLPPLLHSPFTDNDFLPSLEDLTNFVDTGDRDASSTVAANQVAPRKSTNISPRKPFRLSSKQSCEAFVEKKNDLASTLNLLSIALSTPKIFGLHIIGDNQRRFEILKFFEMVEERERSVFWEGANKH